MICFVILMSFQIMSSVRYGEGDLLYTERLLTEKWESRHCLWLWIVLLISLVQFKNYLDKVMEELFHLLLLFLVIGDLIITAIGV